ncbi:MAG: hypothetical protein WD907_03675, partial [Bacilli bacterium]
PKETETELLDIQRRLENIQRYLGRSLHTQSSNETGGIESKARSSNQLLSEKVAIVGSLSKIQEVQHSISRDYASVSKEPFVGNSTIIEALYNFISERSMIITMANYFPNLTEDDQLLVGLELLSLRTWAVNHTLFEVVGNNKESINISDTLDGLLKTDSPAIFDFIVSRTVHYNGLSKLGDPVKNIAHQFSANINSILTLPVEVALDQISSYIKESRTYIHLYNQTEIQNAR